MRNHLRNPLEESHPKHLWHLQFSTRLPQSLCNPALPCCVLCCVQKTLWNGSHQRIPVEKHTAVHHTIHYLPQHLTWHRVWHTWSVTCPMCDTPGVWHPCQPLLHHLTRGVGNSFHHNSRTSNTRMLHKKEQINLCSKASLSLLLQGVKGMPDVSLQHLRTLNYRKYLQDKIRLFY